MSDTQSVQVAPKLDYMYLLNETPTWFANSSVMSSSEKQVPEMTGRANKSRQKLLDLARDMASHEVKLRETENKLKTTLNENSGLKDARESWKNNADKWRKRFEEQSSELSEAKQKASGLSGELKKSRLEIVRLEMDLATSKDATEDPFQEYIEAALKRGLKDEIANVKEKLEQVTQERENDKTQHRATITNLRQDLTSTQKELDSTQKAVSELTEERNSLLQTVCQATKERQSEKQKHEEAIGRLEKEVKKVAKERDAEKCQRQYILCKHEEDIGVLEMQMKEVAEERDTERRQHQEILCKHEESIGGLEEQVKKISEERDTERRQRQDISCKLDDAQALTRQGEIDFEAAQQQNIVLQEQIKKIETSRAKLLWAIDLVLGAWFVPLDGGLLLLSACTPLPCSTDGINLERPGMKTWGTRLNEMRRLFTVA